MIRYLLGLLLVLPVFGAGALAQSKGAEGPTKYQACYVAEKRASAEGANFRSCYRRCNMRQCERRGRAHYCRAAYKYDSNSCGRGSISPRPANRFMSQSDWLARYHPEVSVSAAFPQSRPRPRRPAAAVNACPGGIRIECSFYDSCGAMGSSCGEIHLVNGTARPWTVRIGGYSDAGGAANRLIAANGRERLGYLTTRVCHHQLRVLSCQPR